MKGVNIAIKSDKGLVRKDNQDGVVCLEEAGVFAVADGIGGGAKGALASRMMCEALEKGVSRESGYQERLDEIAAKSTRTPPTMDSGPWARRLRSWLSTRRPPGGPP